MLIRGVSKWSEYRSQKSCFLSRSSHHWKHKGDAKRKLITNKGRREELGQNLPSCPVPFFASSELVSCCPHPWGYLSWPFCPLVIWSSFSLVCLSVLALFFYFMAISCDIDFQFWFLFLFCGVLGLGFVWAFFPFFRHSHPYILKRSIKCVSGICFT